jgi:type I restriction enzyme S subunit
MNNMPTGYKQTEVGVIPEDWNIFQLCEVGKFKNGINKGSEAFGHGSPFVNLMDVFGVSSIASSDSLGLVDTNHAEQQTYDLRKGDVIFIRSSVKPSGVGLTAVIEEDLPKTVYSGFLIRFRDGGTLSRGFKRHCFYEEGFRRRVIGASSVSANTNINQDNLKRLFLVLPPTKAEQEAIAEALSDADALIESLAQLIAKKRHLKQGAMQQLLTGKKRLPGFSGKWEVKRLGELANIRSGGTPSTIQPQFWDGDIPWCTPTDITGLNGFKYISDTSRKISSLGLKSSSAEMIPANSIVMTSRATIGECAINTVSVSTNQGFKNFIPFDHVDVEFLYYLLLMKKQGFISLCGGSTFLEIGKTQLAAFEVTLPAKAEQTAIATLLSDMDAELAALEAKLAKARSLKQGMMQELLTGRIRLV